MSRKQNLQRQRDFMVFFVFSIARRSLAAS